MWVSKDLLDKRKCKKEMHRQCSGTTEMYPGKNVGMVPEYGV